MTGCDYAIYQSTGRWRDQGGDPRRDDEPSVGMSVPTNALTHDQSVHVPYPSPLAHY